MKLLPILLTILVIVMNVVIKTTILEFVVYTRVISKTGLVAKSTIWIIITQFLNMSIIPLIVSNTAEIDADWYQTVGLQLLTTFAANCLTPNIAGLISPFVTMEIDKVTGMLTAIDQHDYNNKMAGPDLRNYVHVRYS